MAKDQPPLRNMPPSPALDALRRQIDELDDGLHDLLCRRAELVEKVAGAKRNGSILPFRPGREAQILRRLVARHRGRFPVPNLIRIWREILSGTVAMQAELTIAVCDGCWDLARDHFGSYVPMLEALRSEEAISAVSEGRAQLGVVPLADDELSVPWWRQLVAAGATRPRVVARLPFGALGNAAEDCQDAFVIAAMEPEPSGDDCTIVAIAGEATLNSAAVTDAFLATEIDSNPLASCEGDGATMHLVELAALLAAGDARIERALARLGRGLQVTWLGFYARPLSDAALGAIEPE